MNQLNDTIKIKRLYTIIPDKHRKKLYIGRNMEKIENEKIGENKTDIKNDGDSDSDEIVFNVEVFKKQAKKVKRVKKNKEVNVHVTKQLLDRKNNSFVFLTVKWNYWTLKSNAMNATFSTLFKIAIDKKYCVHKMFGGCWSVQERKEAYSVVSEQRTLSKNNYGCYVSLFKVLLQDMTTSAAVESIVQTMKKFMKNKNFKTCYLPNLREHNKSGGLVAILEDEKHEDTWTFIKEMSFEIAYDETLDSLITDQDILNICSKVSGQSKEEVFHDQEFGKVMFKNISEKDYEG